MKVYKLEVMIIDQDVDSIEDAIYIIDETRYPNHINVKAITCKEADIGEWDDDNPLNDPDTTKQEMDKLFPMSKTLEDESKMKEAENNEIIKDIINIEDRRKDFLDKCKICECCNSTSLNNWCKIFERFSFESIFNAIGVCNRFNGKK